MSLVYSLISHCSFDIQIMFGFFVLSIKGIADSRQKETNKKYNYEYFNIRLTLHTNARWYLDLGRQVAMENVSCGIHVPIYTDESDHLKATRNT